MNARSTPVRRTPRKRISAQRRLFPLSCILLLFCLNACASPQTASPGGNAAGDAAGNGNAVLSAGSTPESARTGEPAEVPDPTPALPSAEPDAGAQAPEAGGNAETIPPLTIPVPDNERIRRFREQYISENGRKYLSAVMQRSAPYRSFILAETERLGAPGFLLYLPVIESGFSERAVSRSENSVYQSATPRQARFAPAAPARSKRMCCTAMIVFASFMAPEASISFTSSAE